MVLYERLTWPEVRRAIAEDRVALIPVATLEDHGPHLPLDTDLRITAEICRRAADAAPDQVVLLPPIPHGYDPHHMDFPGPISIGWDTFVRYCADVGRSLAHHGFTRMLYLNGHGSNQNLVETAARLVMVDHPGVLAAAAFYLSSPEGLAVVQEVRDSERGGMGHACELETSIYLAIDPEAVDLDRAVDEQSYPETEPRLDGLVRRVAEVHALVVLVQQDGRPRPTHAGQRGQGRPPALGRGRGVRGVRPRAAVDAPARAAGAGGEALRRRRAIVARRDVTR